MQQFATKYAQYYHCFLSHIENVTYVCTSIHVIHRFIYTIAAFRIVYTSSVSDNNIR